MSKRNIQRILLKDNIEDQKVLYNISNDVTFNTHDFIFNDINVKVQQYICNVYEIVDSLIDTLNTTIGTALSAPQIGYNYNVIVIKKQFFPNNKLPKLIYRGCYVLINPKFDSAVEDYNEVEEGCLSIPNKWYLVKRYNSINVQCLNIEQQQVVFDCLDKKLARCIQHECDHLNGITIDLYKDTTNDYNKAVEIRNEIIALNR